MKKLYLLAIILLVSASAFASLVTKKDAEKVAKNHYYQSINNITPTKWENIKLSCIIDPNENSSFNFYVFNINGDEGFVIVSSDDKIKPILSYSFEGGFNYNNMHPGQNEILKYYKDCISFASNSDMEASEKVAQEWQELREFNYENGFKQRSTSPNLLKNIKWNQSWPYNSQCPEDPDGISGHVPVGCVATAMLQVMKYYNWPSSGEGSKYHGNWSNGGYGNITINFANQTYDWASIPNVASSYVNPELGKVNLHAGVAVSMYWGPDGSGSQTYKIEDALEDYFKYSTAANYIEKSNYDETVWKNKIKEQIDDGKPIVYAGTSTTVGHAWNCDGYQDDSYHMNWGWGGAGNGYYTLDNLTSTATVGGPENNFNQNQEMVIDIYPRAGYPEYCNNTRTITGKEGYFDDGSANENYQNNQNCVYVIEPTCGKVISLKFMDFDLAAGDEVILFEGDENSTTVLETFDQNNPPSNSYYTSMKGALTIKFNTDGSENAQGWNVSYKVKNCKTGNVLTEPSGSLSDGSGVCEYSNSSVCTWKINPENVSWIRLNFEDFDLAGNMDYVKIFKDDFTPANEVALFNKDDVPTEEIVINSNIVNVQFYADNSEVASGWKINYTSSQSDIEENKLLSNFSVIPNPGNLNSIVQFSITNNSETNIRVTNILGKTIAIKDFSLTTGLHRFNLSDIVETKLNAGVYYISIDANNQIKTQKFVIVE